MPMEKLEKEKEYYKKRSNDLGSKLLHSQEQATQLKAELRQYQIITKIIAQAYKLSEFGVTISTVFDNLLKFLVTELETRGAMLLVFEPQKNIFEVLVSVGFANLPKTLANVFQPIPQFYYINSKTVHNEINTPIFKAFEQYLEMPYWSFAYNEEYKMALLISKFIEDPRLSPMFSQEQEVLLSSILAVLIDIRHKKDIEEKELQLSKLIAEQNTILENKVVQRTQELNETNEELQSNQEELKQNLEELGAIQEQLQAQYDTLNAKNKNIADSINYAKRIQNAMLPLLSDIESVFPESFVLFRPRDVISGDFYWFINKDDRAILVVADCTGHGVPGAFMSMLGSSLLNQIVHDRGIYQPNSILDLLHTGIEEMLNQKTEGSENKDGMDAAIITFNKNKNIIKFAGANNPLYVFSKQELTFLENSIEINSVKSSETVDGWQLTEIKADKKPIGGRVVQHDNKEYNLKQFLVNQELHLYLFSDGFIDQIGGQERKKLMSKGFKQLLTQTHNQPFTEQKEILNAFFDNWIVEIKKQLDDVLVVGVKI